MAGLLIYNMGAGILQAVGDTRRPLYFLCFSALVNTVLDLLFVIQFHWGVAGVAYATIIAQFLSGLLILIVLSQDSAPYGIRWNHLRISTGILKQIMKIGLPSAIQQAITSFSNVFVQGYINSFGSACMAGWSSYGKLDSLIPRAGAEHRDGLHHLCGAELWRKKPEACTRRHKTGTDPFPDDYGGDQRGGLFCLRARSCPCLHRTRTCWSMAAVLRSSFRRFIC